MTIPKWTGAHQDCPVCKHQRFDWDFVPRRRACRHCRNAAAKARRNRRARKPLTGTGKYARTDFHRERIAEGMRSRRPWWMRIPHSGAWGKQCKSCGALRPLSDFPKHRRTCVSCHPLVTGRPRNH